MKKRNIVIVISLIIGLATTIWMCLSTVNLKIALNDPVTEEDYNYLEECALKIAETADTKVIKDENLIANIDFDSKYLCVTVVLMQYNTDRCKIDAKYPIIFDENIKIENGDIQLKGSIDYQNAIYKKHSDIFSPMTYILINILCGLIVSGIICFFFNEVPKIYKINFPKE